MKQSHSKVPRRLVSCGLANNTRDYYAKLTIHGLPTYDKRLIKRLCKWLRNCADDFEKTDKFNYAKVYTAKLMK